MKVILSEANGNGAVLSAVKQIAARGNRRGREVLVVVPDSYTLSFEREIMQALGATFTVSVTTFRRLFNRLSHVERKYLDAATGAMAVRAIVRDLAGTLRAFGRSARYSSFAERMYELILSLKNCGIAPEDAARAAEAGGILGGKLSDVAAIYAAYENAKADASDSADLLESLPDLIRFEQSFREATCVFAGFDILPKLGEEIFVACAETFSETVFLANRTDKPVFRPVLLGEQIAALLTRRQIAFERKSCDLPLNPFACAATAALGCKRAVSRDARAEARFFAGARTEELEFAAREIKRLAVNGRRYGEFCIVLSDASRYERALRETMARHEIPYWYDHKKRLSEHPLSQYLLGWLFMRSRGYAQEDVLAFVKNPLFFELSEGLKAGEIDVFENYVLKYGIAGKRFFSPFLLASPGDEPLRLRAEAVRIAFEKSARRFEADESGDILDKMLAFVEPERAKSEKWFSDFVSDEDGVFASFSEQAPGYLFALLKSVRAVFGAPDEELFYDLFKSGAERQEVSEIPRSADCVFVGEKESVQYQSFAGIFVLGMNEGEFPSVSEDGGVLNDRDVEALAARGLRFSPKIADNNLRMRFSVLKLLANDYELRYFSTTADARPAECFTELAALCGGEPEPLPEPLEMFSGERVRQNYACRKIRLTETGEGEADDLLAAIAEYAETQDPFLNELLREGAPTWAERLPGEIAGALFYPEKHGEAHTSVSAVETYYRCPFRHFLRYGLRAEERETAEIRPLNIGNILHKTLEEFVRGGAFTGDAARRCFERTIALPEYEKYLSDRKFRPVLDRLCGEAEKVCEAVAKTFLCSEFENLACELGFGIRRENAPAMPSISLSGTSVRLTGVIDRVDVFSLGGKRYCRVVDYKTGASEDLSEAELYFGRKVQLFVYLYALEKNRGFLPAGAYYFPVHNQYRKGEGYAYAMRGATLDEREVLEASDRALVEKEDSEALGIRRSGRSPRGLISEKRLRGYVDYAVRLCEQAIRESSAGDVRMLPSEGVCARCPYRNVCRNFEEKGVRRPADWDKKSVSRALCGESGEEEA